MTIRINLSKCEVCGVCIQSCPDKALSLENGVVVVDQARCTLCKRCIDVCPVDAISDIKSTEEENQGAFPIMQNTNVIKAEPIQITEKRREPIFRNIASGLVLAFFDRVISFLDSGEFSRESNHEISSKRGSHHQNSPVKHRRRRRGR